MTSKGRPDLTGDILARLLRSADSRPRELTPNCQDEQLIAAYVDGRVSPRERETVEAHLADCARCLALVGLLARKEGLDHAAPVPETTLARVRRLAQTAAPAPVRHAPR